MFRIRDCSEFGDSTPYLCMRSPGPVILTEKTVDSFNESNDFEESSVREQSEEVCILLVSRACLALSGCQWTKQEVGAPGVLSRGVPDVSPRKRPSERELARQRQTNVIYSVYGSTETYSSSTPRAHFHTPCTLPHPVHTSTPRAHLLHAYLVVLFIMWCAHFG